MTKITLQKATKEDWKTTLLLEKSAASRFFSAITKKEEIQQYMAKHDVYFITAKEKIIWSIYVEKQNKIDGLIILPKYRNQGIGTYAMKVFLKKLKNEKIIRLVTHPENTPAILLYLKLGFLIKWRKKNHFWDGEPRLLLTKTQKTNHIFK